MNLKWERHVFADAVHIVPHEDEMHDADNCWCKPEEGTRDGKTLVTHRAKFERKESYDRLLVQ